MITLNKQLSFRQKLFGSRQIVDHFDDGTKTNSASDSFSHKLSRFLSYFIIMPSNRWKRVWDVSFIFVVLWVSAFVPFSVAFSPQISTGVQVFSIF